MSPALVVILALWAIALFSGLGLFAQSNGLVIAALTFGAICIAFAMFLILELGPPYAGLFGGIARGAAGGDREHQSISGETDAVIPKSLAFRASRRLPGLPSSVLSRSMVFPARNRMTTLGGKHTYGDRLGKVRSPRDRRHSTMNTK